MVDKVIEIKNQSGFINSLSYTIPDSSPWETRQGFRVPKHITVSLTYQVIHMEVPSLDFVNNFYGINLTIDTLDGLIVVIYTTLN